MLKENFQEVLISRHSRKEKVSEGISLLKLFDLDTFLSTPYLSTGESPRNGSMSMEFLTDILEGGVSNYSEQYCFIVFSF